MKRIIKNKIFLKTIYWSFFSFSMLALLLISFIYILREIELVKYGVAPKILELNNGSISILGYSIADIFKKLKLLFVFPSLHILRRIFLLPFYYISSII